MIKLESKRKAEYTLEKEIIKKSRDDNDDNDDNNNGGSGNVAPSNSSSTDTKQVTSDNNDKSSYDSLSENNTYKWSNFNATIKWVQTDVMWVIYNVAT